MVMIETRLSQTLVRTCGALAVIVVVVLAAFPGTSAQVALPTGQNVALAYEGWEQNPDGSFDLVFGYFNRNWEEEIDVPIGPDNNIEPGGPDQGQPTHFFPRRNRFVFRIRVPKDFGNKELVWTLTTNGKTERAYGTLKPDYFINDIVIQNNTGAGGGGGGANDTIGNTAPVLRVESERTRHVRVGEAVSLTAQVTDDGKPKVTSMPAPLGRLGRTGSRGTPNSATGLRLSWFVYRGANKATFDPPQIKVWEDYRDGANSPWSAGWKTPPAPPDGKWVVRTAFNEPGTYVLRCLAHDGGLSASEDITFVVNR
jgi:hypothetical protein